LVDRDRQCLDVCSYVFRAWREHLTRLHPTACRQERIGPRWLGCCTVPREVTRERDSSFVATDDRVQHSETALGFASLKFDFLLCNQVVDVKGSIGTGKRFGSAWCCFDLCGQYSFAFQLCHFKPPCALSVRNRIRSCICFGSFSFAVASAAAVTPTLAYSPGAGPFC